MTIPRTCPLFMLLLGTAVSSAQAVEIVGHRGASRDAPENTLASVNLAWKRNADAVEIDVFLSKDGKIVVTHDETPKRFGGPDRKVSEQTFAELRTLDLGSWKGRQWAGERMPSLAEVLRTIPDRKRLFIEIKCGPEIVPQLQRDLKAAGKTAEQTAVIGFSYQTVRAVKQALPKLKVYWVVALKQDKKDRAWRPAAESLIRRAAAAKLDGVDLSAKPVIDRDYVARFHKRGLGVYVWTVNSAAEAKRLRAAGVDGVTTDRPGWLKRRLAADRK